MTSKKQKIIIISAAAAASAVLSGCRMAPKFYTSSEIIERDRNLASRDSEEESESSGADNTAGSEETEALSESISETETETEAVPSIDQDVLREQLATARAAYGQDFTWACAIPSEKKDFPFDVLARQYILTDYMYPDFPALQDEDGKNLEILKSSLTQMLDSYDGNWSVYVHNLTTDEAFVINDTPQRSASLMKLFILGAVFKAIDDGELTGSEETMSQLSNMITVSSNTAANALLYKLGDGDLASGIEKVNKYIEDEGYSSGTHEYNGFEDSDTILDPDHFNQVMASDIGDLLTRVYHRTFGSRTECNELEDWMLNQQTRYKIPAGLPVGTSVGNKTGETSDTENDAAVIYTQECDYILVVLSNSWSSKDTAQHEIQQISAKVYDYLCTDSTMSWAHLFPELRAELED